MMTHIKKYKSGFTLVEVTLFLVITGVLLIGSLTITWNAISRQRTNDMVESFADFLATQYSAISNVQSNGSGNSDKAIYGRVLTFGEENSSYAIHIYNLIGDVVPSEKIVNLTIPKIIDLVNADVVLSKEDEATHRCSYSTPGATDYSAKYGAALNDTDKNKLKGSLLIIRSPKSGTIHTYFLDKTISVQSLLNDQEVSGGLLSCDISPLRAAMYNDDTDEVSYEMLKKEEVDFCLRPDDGMFSRIYDIRLAKDANNSTGIEIINLDSDNNRCEK